MKNLYLLGATGSIGRQTLDIVRRNPDRFRVVTMTAHTKVAELLQLMEEFHPLFVAMSTREQIDEIKAKFPDVKVGYGRAGLVRAATYMSDDKTGLLVNALVGISGLVPTVEAIQNGRNVALANKETLVVGGEIILPLLEKHHASLYPIDSEHSAIWQCLRGEESKNVRRIIITASGGALRDVPIEQLANATKAEALSHPTWSMGDKITIDSATMMNKGFEVIEAHYLFHMPLEKIEIIMHPESIVHSMVEYVDKSIVAQLSSHDMRLPIDYALHYPDRLDNAVAPLELAKLGSLTFKAPDLRRYPCFVLAMRAIQEGGSMPCVLNAANEVAVKWFLEGKISFGKIAEIVEDALFHHQKRKAPNLETLISVDRQVRERLFEIHSPKE